MEYNYTKNSLLHSVGFNLARFKSVIDNGIYSYNNGVKKGINISKNYLVNSGSYDYISCVCVGNINYEDVMTAYNLHTVNGINFIIENTQYLDRNSSVFVHRIDEVLVKDEIPLTNIKGLAIPDDYLNMNIKYISVIPSDITSFDNLESIIDNYIKFLKEYGFNKDVSFNNYYQKIFDIGKLYKECTDKNQKDKLNNEYINIISDINFDLGMYTYNTFKEIIGDKITLKDIVMYLSDGKYQIYNIPVPQIGLTK